MALLALSLTLPLLLIGSYISGADHGLACSGWPLCNGQIVPTEGGESVQIHYMHRLLALIVGVVLLGLAWLGWQSRREAPLAAALSVAAFAIFIIQALIGAANIWTRLADEVSAAHLGVATLLWLLLAVLNIRVHRLYELLPMTATTGEPNLAGQTR
jgi:heme A synthase